MAELVFQRKRGEGRSDDRSERSRGVPLSDQRKGAGTSRVLADFRVAHSPEQGIALPTHQATGMPTIQRKPVRVPKGGASGSTWKFIRSDANYDYYDDGLPDHPEVAALQPTRDAVEQMDMGELSDIDQSDTELDYATKGPHTVYRVNSLRDSAKMVHQVMRPSPDSTFGVRMGDDGPIFRLSGKGSQFTLQSTTSNALVQSDDSQGSGAMPARSATDPQATGNVNSYEHVLTELRKHSAKSIAEAIHNKYVNGQAYPKTFSPRAQAKMDETFALLSIVEPFRTPYAFALFAAAIQAMINGASTKEILFAGKGQIEALHPGASSHSSSGVSGQLMEQNLGMGANYPHPTQSSMNISDSDWHSGLKRTVGLFDKAGGSDYASMLKTHMQIPMGLASSSPSSGAPTGSASGSTDITTHVSTTRAPGNWGDAVVTLSGITVTVGQSVTYNGKKYTVKNITGGGWVILKNA